MADIYEKPELSDDGDDGGGISPQGLCTPFVGVVVVIVGAVFMVGGVYNYVGAANVVAAALAATVVLGAGTDCTDI